MSRANRDRFLSPLYRLASLRPGEGRKTLLLSLYLFLIVGGYLIAKSVRDGLFLDRYGVFKLPYVIIGIALAVGFFVSGYVRLAKRIEPTRLVVGTLALFISNLVLFWWMIRQGYGAAYPIIYIWVGMYGVIAPAQVWTLANDVFTTRQAKRTFALIGSGGILGAIAGSWLTREFALRIGAVPLLLFMAFLLFLAALLVLALSRHRLAPGVRLEAFPAPRHLRDSLKLIAGSSHLRLVAWLVFLTALATTTADYQFKAVAVESLGADPNRLTAFFGTFYGSVGILSLFVQFLATSRLLRGLGLGRTILLLPIAMLLASLALLPTLALSAAILLKGADGAMKHSVDRSARELAYLPVDRRIKIHVKSTIDMVVDRLGDGLGGVVLLILIALPGAGLRTIIACNLVFLGLWIFTALRLRRSYTQELARSIRKGQVEIGSWHEALAGAEMLQGIRDALNSEEKTRVLAALELVAGQDPREFLDSLSRLASEGSPEVRARAMAILLDPNEPGFPEGIAARFQEEDQSLLSECVDFLAAEGFEEKRKYAESILRRAGGRSRGVWVALMLRRLGNEFRPFGRALLEHMADRHSDAGGREAAATAVGMMPSSQGLWDLLPRLLEDPEERVVQAAVRSAGVIGGHRLVASVIDLLDRPAARQAARRMFRSMGDESLPILMEKVQDPDTPLPVRKQIPRCIALIGGDRSVRSLIRLLDHPAPAVSGAARAALARYRPPRLDLPLLSRHRVERLCLEIAAGYRRHRSVAAFLEGTGRFRGEEGSFLRSALHESMEKHRAALFETLGLHYSPGILADCRHSLGAAGQEERANAAELLESILPGRLWREIQPILYSEKSGSSREDRVEADQDLNPEQVILELVGDPDPWVSACALYLGRREGLDRVREAAVRRVRDPDFRVRDAAALFDGGGVPMRETPSGVFDKLMALKQVDLFSAIPTGQLSLIAAVARIADFPEKAILCRQGDPPGDLYVVLEGKAEIRRDGRPSGEMAPGDSLGAWGLFEDEPRQATVQASGALKVLRIDRRGFDDLLQEHPEVSRSLIRRMIGRLRELSR